MKEYPIIMSGNHPKLVLDLLKTMTRRTKGLNKINEHPDDWTVDLQGNIAAFRNIHTGEDVLIRCPYGQVGDRLWVRETHKFTAFGFALNAFIEYKDGEQKDVTTYIKDGTIVYNQDHPNEHKWRPSIFMPRWASRITLEITEVRVERVQEIDEDGATAEGITEESQSFNAYEPHYDLHRRDAFRRLWDSLNAKRGYGWDVNPWVWVIGFRKIE